MQPTEENTGNQHAKSILIVKIENATEENREHESQFQHDRQLFISLLLTNARKYVVPEKR